MSGRLGLAGVSVACLVMLGLAPAAGAQPGPQAGSSETSPSSPEWGISAPIAYVVSGWEFQHRGDAQGNVMDDYLYQSAGSYLPFTKQIYLPSGAVIDGVTVFDYDAATGGYVSFRLSRLSGTPTTGLETTQLLYDDSVGFAGYQGGYHALAAPETVHNVDPGSGESRMYVMEVYFAAMPPTPDLRFGGATVWYRLQISPAPATATFADVPTGYWAFRHIEALAASGITAGCGGGNFCPESTVTRAEMAVFLAKALGLHWPDGPAL